MSRTRSICNSALVKWAQLSLIGHQCRKSLVVSCATITPKSRVLCNKRKVGGCGSVQQFPQHMVFCAIFSNSSDASVEQFNPMEGADSYMMTRSGAISRITPVKLYLKSICSNKLRRCFCCATMPGNPCWDIQDECLNVCPERRYHRCPRPPTAPIDNVMR